MDPVETVEDGCGVKFMWTPPGDNGGAVITGYVLTMKTKLGQFTAISDCGHQGDSSECTVDMETLSGAPYYFRQGDELQDRVKISATNRAGISIPSNYNKKAPAVVIQEAPETIGQLEKVETTENSVTLRWRALSPGTIYHVFSQHGIEPFKLLTETDENQVTPDHLRSGELYLFRVDVKHVCGIVKSKVLDVLLPSKPQKMHPIKTTIEGCSVRFTWKSPDFGSSLIRRYMLRVNVGEELVPLERCGEDLNFEYCIVPMATLESAPFNIKRGESITDRVTIAAENQLGFGPYSEFNFNSTSQVTLFSKPEQITSLNFTGPINNTALLTWKAPENANLSFTIYQAKASSMLERRSTVTTQWYNAAALQPGETYKFRIDASNVCGTTRSQILALENPRLPPKMKPVKSIENGCGVRFEWEKIQNKGKELIISYSVKVRGKNGAMYIL